MTRTLTLQELSHEVLAEVDRHSSPSRLVVGIAGAPGSGKSTAAEALLELLNAGKPGLAAVLPMDGFHYDDGLLDQLGRRARKGAPDTFDVGGFRHCLLRLRENAEEAVAVPVFDRSLEIARAGARLIDRGVRVIIAEGNYLLLGREPWHSVLPLLDMRVMLDTDVAVLRSRLEARWRGFNLPEQEVRRRVEQNDLPNALFVIRESGLPQYLVKT